MSADRLPWLKFWPTDWQRDSNLRTVSLACRGLWIELIGVMNGCEPYGHLVINGKAATSRQIGLLVGATTRQVEKLLVELEEAGVFSRTEDGIIYSRRMVRDYDLRLRSQAFGSTGGNPALKPGVNPPLNGHARADSEAKKLESEKKESPPTPASGGGCGQIDFEMFYERYPIAAGLDAARRAWRRVIRRGADPAEIMRALDAALKAGRLDPKKRLLKEPASWLTGGNWKDGYRPPSLGTLREGRAEMVAELIAEGRSRAEAEGLADLGYPELAASPMARA